MIKKFLTNRKRLYLVNEHRSHKVNKMKKPYYTINATEKTMKALELLAEKGELSVAQTACQLGMNRSTCHRFLSTLRDLGYVAQTSLSHYKLSLKLFEVGTKVIDRIEIRKIAQPYLKELSVFFNETLNLGCLDNNEIVHLDKINSTEILRIDPSIGSRVPAYCTALGKAILAYLPEEELNKFLKSVSLKKMTENTITTTTNLLKEFEKIRKQGCAVDSEELCRGLRCVASPVLGYTNYPLYSISVAGPVSRMNKEKIKAIKGEIKRVCSELSKSLRHLQ
jgi:DNA-binding IclR family transcriptional regulator